MFIEKNVHINVRIRRIRIFCGILLFYKYMNPLDSAQKRKND